jgi:RNA polymerase sigma-70 factor (ECF subfamily)
MRLQASVGAAKLVRQAIWVLLAHFSALYERATGFVSGFFSKSGIIRRVRRETFERLYAEHAEPLLGFLIYRTGDRPLAEDLLGDTFERAIRARLRFDRRKSSEKTWLYAIALNCLRDQQRRAGVEQRAVELASADEPTITRDPAVAVEARDAVARALETLSDDEQDAVALRYGAELTVPEIAKATGLRQSTARGRLYGAMKKLRDELEQD